MNKPKRKLDGVKSSVSMLTIASHVRNICEHCLSVASLRARCHAKREKMQSQTAENGSVFSFLSSISFLLHRDKRKEIDINPAFTLAEVLIVLGIIGLIADMTIPTLVSSTKEKIAVVRLQKAYSTLESALRMAVSENGLPDEWDIDNEKMIKNLSTLIISKDCKFDTGCFANSYKTMNNNLFNDINDLSFYKVILSDGVSLMSRDATKNCDMDRGTNGLENTCGAYYVDINGLNAPNIWGQDLFMFYLTKKGIIPAGIQNAVHEAFSTHCNMSSSQYFNGAGCTAWVIYSENMDYLHCNDLSWDGKKSCK